MLHHVEINVSNLSQSRAFWNWFLCDRLGYHLFQQWEEGVSFKFKDTYIVFVQTEGDFLGNQYHRKNTGLNHLAFHAPSTDAVNRLANELKEKGIRLLYGSPITSGKSYAVFFEDPDKIKVEFSATISNGDSGTLEANDHD